jgi:uncharacterized protein YbjQ (UPF0145 family)
MLIRKTVESMILSTTPSIDGKDIGKYIAVLGAEVFIPFIDFGGLAELITMAKNAVDSGNPVYERYFTDARQKALEILASKAVTFNADAVVNIHLDFIVVGPRRDGLMLAATGTAVQFVMTDEQRARIAEQDEGRLAREKENEPAYMIEIDGRIRGPFSVVQLRELEETKRIAADSPTRMENGNTWLTVEEVINLKKPA